MRSRYFNLMKTFVLAVWGLLALFAASSFAQSQDDAKADEAKPNVPKVEMLTCNVLILDPDGNPIEDATVSPSGLRTKAQPGGHWIWQEKQFGTVPKRKTNTNGLVEMTYPKFHPGQAGNRKGNVVSQSSRLCSIPRRSKC